MNAQKIFSRNIYKNKITKMSSENMNSESDDMELARTPPKRRFLQGTDACFDSAFADRLAFRSNAIAAPNARNIRTQTANMQLLRNIELPRPTAGSANTSQVSNTSNMSIIGTPIRATTRVRTVEVTPAMNVNRATTTTTTTAVDTTTDIPMNWCSNYGQSEVHHNPSYMMGDGLHNSGNTYPWESAYSMGGNSCNDRLPITTSTVYTASQLCNNGINANVNDIGAALSSDLLQNRIYSSRLPNSSNVNYFGNACAYGDGLDGLEQILSTSYCGMQSGGMQSGGGMPTGRMQSGRMHSSRMGSDMFANASVPILENSIFTQYTSATQPQAAAAATGSSIFTQYTPATTYPQAANGSSYFTQYTPAATQPQSSNGSIFAQYTPATQSQSYYNYGYNNASGISPVHNNSSMYNMQNNSNNNNSPASVASFYNAWQGADNAQNSSTPSSGTRQYSSYQFNNYNMPSAESQLGSSMANIGEALYGAAMNQNMYGTQLANYGSSSYPAYSNYYTYGMPGQSQSQASNNMYSYSLQGNAAAAAAYPGYTSNYATNYTNGNIYNSLMQQNPMGISSFHYEPTENFAYTGYAEQTIQ